MGPGKTYYMQRIASGKYCIVFIQHNTAFEFNFNYNYSDVLS